MRWDIFCKVIDNHGDIGVCWRLAAELAQHGDAVRLWADDPSVLLWMAPDGADGVEVRTWAPGATEGAVAGDAVVEAFGCELDDGFAEAMATAARARGEQPAWFNLEYLSAERYVERCHGLPSPVVAGPARGLVKQFFYPGFTPRTGGLLREQDLAARQAVFDRGAWLRRMGLPDDGEALLVSLFCYEPPLLGQLLAQLAEGPRPVRLLVAAGRPTAAVQKETGLQGAPALRGELSISYLPLLPQPGYDALLWASDFNFVRGEDSLVRALWADRPFTWQLYPQDDGAHLAKLDAFLDWLEAPASLRAFHAAWNGASPALPAFDVPAWDATAREARQRLLAQPDLVTTLRQAALAFKGAAPSA